MYGSLDGDRKQIQMTRSHNVCRLTHWLMIALGLGCGSSNSHPAAVVTSVDNAKVLSSLSLTEMQTLCSDFNNYLVQQTAQDYAARLCIQSGLIAAGLSDASQASLACHNAYNNCMGPSNSKNSSGITINGLCPNTTPSAPACSLTVSQYAACLTDLVPAVNAAWASRNDLCDNLTSCTGLCSSPLTLPASCSLINTTCPDLIPDFGSYVTVS